MSEEKEKYLGESLLSQQPKKKMSLVLKDKTVTAQKLADKAVTPQKVSDDFVNKIVKPSVDRAKADLQNQIDSIAVGGLAVSNEWGDNPNIAISQKTLTEAFNNIYDAIGDDLDNIDVLYFTDYLEVKPEGFEYSSLTYSGEDGDITYIVQDNVFALHVGSKYYLSWIATETREASDQYNEEKEGTLVMRDDKLYYYMVESTNSDINVDNALDADSDNPVSNKAVCAGFASIAPLKGTITVTEMIDAHTYMGTCSVTVSEVLNAFSSGRQVYLSENAIFKKSILVTQISNASLSSATCMAISNGIIYEITFAADFGPNYIMLCERNTGVTVDSEMSSTSTNPVQNKTITSALNNVSEDYTDAIDRIIALESVEPGTSLLHFDEAAAGISPVVNQSYAGDGGTLVLDVSIGKMFLKVFTNNAYRYYPSWNANDARESNYAYANLEKVLLWKVEEGRLHIYRYMPDAMDLIEVAGGNGKCVLEIKDIIRSSGHYAIAEGSYDGEDGDVCYYFPRKYFVLKVEDSLLYKTWLPVNKASSSEYNKAELVYRIDGEIAIYKPTEDGLVKLNEVDHTVTEQSSNPVASSAVYEALATKQDVLQSGVSIKTLNNQSLLGSGNIDVAGLSNEIPCIYIRFIGENPQEVTDFNEGDLYYDDAEEVLYLLDSQNTEEVPFKEGYLYYIGQNLTFYVYQQNGGLIPIAFPADSSLSTASKNAVQNKVVTNSLNDKQNALTQGSYITIESREDLETASEKLFIDVRMAAFEKYMREECQAIIDIKKAINTIHEGLFPEVVPIPEPSGDDEEDTYDPLVDKFDSVKGNWGSIKLSDALCAHPENITVSDVMDSDYDVPLLIDWDDAELVIVGTAEQVTSGYATTTTIPNDGEYVVTGKALGLHNISNITDAVDNTERLEAVASSSGTYADCVGLLLERAYYFYSRYSVDYYGGILIEKDFTIKGIPEESGDAPGLWITGYYNTTYPSHIYGNFFFTRNSLNLVDTEFHGKKGGYGMFNIDCVKGIDQIQVIGCTFKSETNNSCRAIVTFGRDIPPGYLAEHLYEFCSIKHYLVYNNTFEGTLALYNGNLISAGNSASRIKNYDYSSIETLADYERKVVVSTAKFLYSCRIVNNTFSSIGGIGINFGAPNENVEERSNAYTQCPVYIVGNDFIGLEELVDCSGSDHEAVMLEWSRAFFISNQFKNFAGYAHYYNSEGKVSSGYANMFIYSSVTQLYMANNVFHNLAKFSSSCSGPELIFHKNLQVPTRFLDTHIPTIRYIINNEWQNDDNKLMQWWNTYCASSNKDQDLINNITPQNCLGASMFSFSETNQPIIDEFKFIGNLVKMRVLYGKSSSATRVEELTIQDNTFNFATYIPYENSADSPVFSLSRCENIDITDNTFTGSGFGSNNRIPIFMFYCQTQQEYESLTQVPSNWVIAPNVLSDANYLLKVRCTWKELNSKGEMVDTTHTKSFAVVNTGGSTYNGYSYSPGIVDSGTEPVI